MCELMTLCVSECTSAHLRMRMYHGMHIECVCPSVRACVRACVHAWVGGWVGV